MLPPAITAPVLTKVPIMFYFFESAMLKKITDICKFKETECLAKGFTSVVLKIQM
jgi:hypothetical protein